MRAGPCTRGAQGGRRGCPIEGCRAFPHGCHRDPPDPPTVPATRHVTVRSLHRGESENESVDGFRDPSVARPSRHHHCTDIKLCIGELVRLHNPMWRVGRRSCQASPPQASTADSWFPSLLHSAFSTGSSSSSSSGTFPVWRRAAALSRRVSGTASRELCSCLRDILAEPPSLPQTETSSFGPLRRQLFHPSCITPPSPPAPELRLRRPREGGSQHQDDPTDEHPLPDIRDNVPKNGLARPVSQQFSKSTM